ncbi:MAG: SCO family protein, partial [Rhodospirillales bacterium]|nr:SCO family protein [Rhodospirillales bacterium]
TTAAAALPVQAEEPVRLPGGPFMLVDHNGKTVTDADFRGRFLLVFFGYTFCPDICPTALSTVADAFDLLGDEAEKVEALFISVDPARDTVPVMHEYVAHFHPRITGLTGPEPLIADAAKKYKARYKKVIPPGSKPDEYLIDHSAGVLLMGPKGEFLKKFLHGIKPEEMAEGIRSFLR